MKVLQLIHKPQLRGAEIFAAQLTNHLVQLGHPSKLLSIYEDEAHNYNSAYSSINANAKARLWDHSGWKRLARAIAKEKPDVVQANAGDTLKYAVFSKLLYGWQQPLVFRNASTLSLYLKSGIQKAYTAFLFSQVEAVASVSEFSKQDLIELFPALKDKARVIPIGLEKKVPVQNPFSLSEREKVNLVHVGGFSFEKNHRGLLHIFEQLQQQLPQVHLWLVGDGPLRGQIESLVKKKGLQDKVNFTGFVTNPLDYIAHAQALLLPSIIEGLPGVILEAMLYETPVVAYKVGGIGEVIQPQQTGWLVEKNDEEGFVRALLAVIKEPGNTNQMVENAQQLVYQHYMNRSIAKSFLTLYQQVLHKKPEYIKESLTEH